MTPLVKLSELISNEEPLNSLFRIKNEWQGVDFEGFPISVFVEKFETIIATLKLAESAGILEQIPTQYLKLFIENIQAIALQLDVIKRHNFSNPGINPHQGSNNISLLNTGQTIQRNVSSSAQNIVNHILSLEANVYNSRISDNVVKPEDTSKEILELSNLLDLYKKTLNQIQNIELLESKIIDSETKVKQIETSLISVSEEAQTQLSLIIDNNTNSANTLSMIQKNLDSTKEMNQEIENRKIQIVAFYENIESYKDQIEENSKRVEKFIEGWDQDLKQNSQDQQKRTDTIVTKNEEYQSIISTLLNGANAGSLNKTFEDKARSINENQKWWLTGIILSTIAVVFLSLFEFEMMENVAIWEKLAQRSILVIPIILLDIFLVFQYNKRQQLIDEYHFKSSMALSLWAFNDLIVKNKEEDISKEFIISTIHKIYDSPFESVDTFNKQQKELLNRFLNFTAEKGDKITDNLIERLNK